ARQGRRVAPGRARDLMDLVPLLAPFAGVGRVGEPAVIEPPDALEARAHHAADPDRRPSRTVRPRAEHGVFHDPAAVPGDRLATPQFPAEAQPFEHAADPPFE